MSTRTDQKTYDDQYFKYFIDYAYPNVPYYVKEWILQNMVPNGDIAIESMLETAIAKANNIQKYSTVGSDFLNNDGTAGGDAKKATVAPNPNRPRLEARVTDFHNKTGDLYICVYEPTLSKFYFFNVPRTYYKNRKSLQIYFELDGTPRRKKMRCTTKSVLWDFECKSGIHNLTESTKKKKNVS